MKKVPGLIHSGPELDSEPSPLTGGVTRLLPRPNTSWMVSNCRFDFVLSRPFRGGQYPTLASAMYSSALKRVSNDCCLPCRRDVDVKELAKISFCQINVGSSAAHGKAPSRKKVVGQGWYGIEEQCAWAGFVPRHDLSSEPLTIVTIVDSLLSLPSAVWSYCSC